MTITQVLGNGYMIQPVARGVMTRRHEYKEVLLAAGVDVTKDTNIDYDMMSLDGGGAYVVRANPEAPVHGVCGDKYSLDTPRPHELLGKYVGAGPIAATYIQGSTIDIKIQVTSSHKGNFYFQICKLLPGQVESEDCFREYLVNAKSMQQYWEEEKLYVGVQAMSFVLPKELVCEGKERCVLRWYWLTGNSPSSKMKDEFWNCADIQIKRRTGKSSSTTTTALEEKVVDPSSIRKENDQSVSSQERCRCTEGDCPPGNPICRNCLMIYQGKTRAACYLGWSASQCLGAQEEKIADREYRWCGN